MHRAVDASADPIAGVVALVDTGVRRVLTSGAADCRGDLDALRAMAAVARRRIEVMAGGGVTVEDIGVLREAGVDAVHLSARGRWRRGGPSGPGGGESGFDTTDAALVRAVVEAARAVPR